MGKVARRERRVLKRKERTEEVEKQRSAYTTRQRNKRILNTTLFVVVLGAALYGIILFLQGPKEGEHDVLAQCLTERGVIMYGTDWCPHCQAQKRAFGSSFRYVNYINCDLNSQACDLAGVEGYPTWSFGDGVLTGEQSLEVLAQRAGC